MNGEPSNAVFISYRREEGGILAMALYQHLAEHGLDAFYDIESIRAGQFDTIILNQIAARPYFLLVLTPGTLERASDPSDWVRREIEQALTTRRVIVPVHTPNFDFGDFERFLPDGLGREVQRFNGQELPQKWFKFAVQQLVEEFLVPTEIETVAPPAEEQTVVDRLHQAAMAAPAVTDVHLSAQEYFERGYARAAEDVDGRIADYSEAIRLNPEYALAFNNRGIARHAAGDLEAAIADFDQALRVDPQYALAFYNRGVSRAAAGDLEGAISDYSEAIRLSPEAALAAHVFNNRAVARGAAGDLERAIADYSEAIRLNPKYVTFYNRANDRAAAGDPEGAIADYSEAIRLNPEYAPAFLNRGNARYSRDDLEGAITDYSEAMRLDPEDPVAVYNRGNTRVMARDLEGAIADYSEAIRLNPDYVEAFYNRAIAHRNAGDLEAAIADVEHGARLAPDDEDFPRLLDKLRKRLQENGRA